MGVCQLVKKKMWQLIFLLFTVLLSAGVSYPTEFLTKRYTYGIEYEHSLPMTGDSNRFRHRNNYNPFFVTVTASAKKGYVLDYLVVTAKADAGAEIDFRVVQGQPGTSKMVFQLVSNHSDFLYYSYISYGIKETDYAKMANHIIIPMSNKARVIKGTIYVFVLFVNALLQLPKLAL